MKTKLFAIFILMVTCFAMQAEDFVYWLDSKQYNQWTDSPNFVKAHKLLEDNPDSPNDIIDILDKEIAAHPSNGYALCNKTILMVVQDNASCNKYVYSEDEDSVEMGKVLLDKALHKALDMMEKGRNLIPEADKENRAYSWIWTALFYKMIDNDDTTPMIEALEKSAELYPINDIYDILMELTWNPEDVSKTEKYARLALEKDPNNPTALEAMLGICKVRNDHESFVKYFDQYKGIKQNESIDNDIKLAYAVALTSTRGQDAAIDYFFNNFEDDYETLERSLLAINADPEIVLMKIGQREFALEGEADYWNMIKGNIYCNQLKNYKEALNCYNKIENKVNANDLNRQMKKCCYMTGDINKAMVHAQAVDYLTETDIFLMDIQLNQGMIDPVIKYLTNKIEMGEFLETAEQDYIRLALCYLLKKDYQQAATISNKALAINEESPEALLYYGIALKALGRDNEANKYLEKTFDATYIDGITPVEEVIQSQASIMLGRTVEGRKMLEELEQNWQSCLGQQEPGDPIYSKADCYDIAAIYAMLGDYGKIQEWMQKHFEYDYLPYNFGFMALDRRFDNVRDVPMFKQLVDKYYQQWKNNK